MGIRARNGNDRSRTIWTPEMDRFFLDLLLEQVSEGNKFDDHLFSKRAWKQMSSLFNAKFKFQYEKEVLKNRHKTLRNLYKAVNRLLDQKGFSWDENRQMVTADNKVWDEYIKISPDVRAYRLKTIPYYKDLCVIYGGNTVDEKGEILPEMFHDSSGNELTDVTDSKNANEGACETADLEELQEITVDEEFRISISEEREADSASKELADDVQQARADDPGSSASSRTRTYWQPPMDRYFIYLMLDHLWKGNQIDGVFRKQAWIDMITSFNNKFGFSYDVEVLKNRYKTLRRQYNVINNLLELDGFAWDDSRQMVTADDDVWQDYIKTHADARQFMTRPIPYFKDLCIICGDQSVAESVLISNRCLEIQNGERQPKILRLPLIACTSVSSEDEVGDALDSAYGQSNPAAANHKNKRQLEHQFRRTKSLKRTQSKEETTTSASEEIAGAVSPFTDKKLAGSSYSISIENVVKAIQVLPDMDEDLILDACDFLEDEVKAKTFMALDVKLRKKWLLRKLRPET